MTAAEIDRPARRPTAAASTPRSARDRRSPASACRSTGLRGDDRRRRLARAEPSWSRTGACSEPPRPGRRRRPPDVASTSSRRSSTATPTSSPRASVLVVGASASGVQIADELQRSGREVTVAVGDHVRLPRARTGAATSTGGWTPSASSTSATTRSTTSTGPAASRRCSWSGSPERRDLDLNTLTARRARSSAGSSASPERTAQFSGGLANLVASADLKQDRLLDRIDEFAARNGLDDELAGTVPTAADPRRPGADRAAAGRVRHGRLGDRLPADLPVAGPAASRPPRPAPPRRRRRRRCPALYVLGLPFLRRRKSSFIDGVGPDAAELMAEVRLHLDRVAAGTAA